MKLYFDLLQLLYTKYGNTFNFKLYLNYDCMLDFIANWKDSDIELFLDNLQFNINPQLFEHFRRKLEIDLRIQPLNLDKISYFRCRLMIIIWNIEHITVETNTLQLVYSKMIKALDLDSNAGTQPQYMEGMLHSLNELLHVAARNQIKLVVEDTFVDSLVNYLATVDTKECNTLLLFIMGEVRLATRVLNKINRMLKVLKPCSWDTIMHKKTFAPGLYNYKANCGTNTILQLLYSIPVLKKEIMTANTGRNVNTQLLQSLQKLFYKMDNTDGHMVYPHDVLQNMTVYNEEIDVTVSYDCEAILLSLIDTLQTNAPSLHKLLGFTTVTQVNGFCDHSSDARFEMCSNISINVRLTNGKCIQSLNEGLDNYFETEKLVGDCKWNCGECKKRVKAYKTMKLSCLPEILIITLRRYTNTMKKLTNKVSFDTKLNVEKYLDVHEYKGDSKDDDTFNYELQSVILHSGDVNSGHYKILTKHNSDWLLKNDDKVDICQDSCLAELGYGGSDANDTAYMLVYQNLKSLKEDHTYEFKVDNTYQTQIDEENNRLQKLFKISAPHLHNFLKYADTAMRFDDHFNAGRVDQLCFNILMSVNNLFGVVDFTWARQQFYQNCIHFQYWPDEYVENKLLPAVKSYELTNKYVGDPNRLVTLITSTGTDWNTWFIMIFGWCQYNEPQTNFRRLLEGIFGTLHAHNQYNSQQVILEAIHHRMYYAFLLCFIVFLTHFIHILCFLLCF